MMYTLDGQGPMVNSMFNKIINAVVMWIGSVHWSPKNTLTDSELVNIRESLTQNYYIILTRRNNHLSTYVAGICNLFLFGKMGYWSHALMNTEDGVRNDSDFRLLQATSIGVAYEEFNKVFDVNSVVLLKPKSLTIDEWTKILDKARSDLGKPYDTLFDINSQNSFTCVDLVRNALMGEPNYSTDFVNFEAMVQKHKRLSPDMFYNCPDFEVVLEIRN